MNDGKDDALGAAQATTAPAAEVVTRNPSNPIQLIMPKESKNANLVDRVRTGLIAEFNKSIANSAPSASRDTDNRSTKRRVTPANPLQLAIDRLKSDLSPSQYYKASLPCLYHAFDLTTVSSEAVFAVSLETDAARHEYIVNFCTAMMKKYGGGEDPLGEFVKNLTCMVFS